MRRAEAVALLAAALLGLTAGLVWLFGPFGLLGVAVGVVVLVLFVVDVEEGPQ